MTIKIEIKQHGNIRWIRFACPDCEHHCIKSVTATNGKQNEKEFNCSECNALLVVKWDSSDEKMS